MHDGAITHHSLEQVRLLAVVPALHPRGSPRVDLAVRPLHVPRSGHLDLQPTGALVGGYLRGGGEGVMSGGGRGVSG